MWTTVTAAFAVGRLCESSSARGPPRRSVTEDADVLAGDRYLVVGEQRLNACRGARDRPGHGQRKPTHVEAINVVGIELHQRRLEVDLRRRRRVLEQDGVVSVVVVEPVHRAEYILLRTGRWQVHVHRGCSPVRSPWRASCRHSGRSRHHCRRPGGPAQERDQTRAAGRCAGDKLRRHRAVSERTEGVLPLVAASQNEASLLSRSAREGVAGRRIWPLGVRRSGA